MYDRIYVSHPVKGIADLEPVVSQLSMFRESENNSLRLQVSPLSFVTVYSNRCVLREERRQHRQATRRSRLWRAAAAAALALLLNVSRIISDHKVAAKGA